VSEEGMQQFRVYSNIRILLRPVLTTRSVGFDCQRSYSYATSQELTNRGLQNGCEKGSWNEL
jgi:hypothetical protein